MAEASRSTIKQSKDESADALRVSSAHFIRNFSNVCDTALREPVIISRNGRDRLVLMGVDEYWHLRDLLNHSQQTASATDAPSPGDAGAKD